MVRRDDVIESEADMSALARDFRLEGGGGTDFRPVFRYVDELVRNGELRGLKGLMYFTDGIGTYPEKRPGYDTAFVFCDDRCREREIPPWAMRLDIQTEDLAEGGMKA
jgi:predicted metal-dependent peptidase